jgi:hypothetical protein
VIDAVSLMTPNHPGPSPSICRSQSSARSSSSVAAGDVFHNIALTFERRHQHLGHHTGRGSRDGEIGEEAGVVPVRHAGQKDALEVVEDRVYRFGSRRRCGGELPGDVTGRHLGQHRNRPGSSR